MRLLLETHVLLWWVSDDRRLKAPERDAIADEDSGVWVSAASIWEISIKRSLGRIELAAADLDGELRRGRRAREGSEGWSKTRSDIEVCDEGKSAFEPLLKCVQCAAYFFRAR